MTEKLGVSNDFMKALAAVGKVGGPVAFESDLIHYDQLKKKETSGRKDDTGKPPLDLLDPLALEGIAAVLAFGATKYAKYNWRGGIAYSRLIASVMRHLFAIIRGEDRDPESGLPHIDHAGAGIMFLSHFMKTRPDLDDRYKGK